jgi:hypothetical protein
MATYFISQDYLKKYTPIDGNVDQKLLNPVILSAQEDYIKPVLGTDLYNKLVSDIQASTVTGDYKTLLDDYIRPALREWCVYECIGVVSFKIRNNGLIVQGNEGGQAASLQQLERYEDKYYKKAKIKQGLFYDWLCANSDLFTEYSSNTDDGDRSPIGVSNSYGGLWLGMKRKKYNDECCDE